MFNDGCVTLTKVYGRQGSTDVGPLLTERCVSTSRSGHTNRLTSNPVLQNTLSHRQPPNRISRPQNGSYRNDDRNLYYLPPVFRQRRSPESFSNTFYCANMCLLEPLGEVRMCVSDMRGNQSPINCAHHNGPLKLRDIREP